MKTKKRIRYKNRRKNNKKHTYKIKNKNKNKNKYTHTNKNFINKNKYTHTNKNFINKKRNISIKKGGVPPPSLHYPINKPLMNPQWNLGIQHKWNTLTTLVNFPQKIYLWGSSIPSQGNNTNLFETLAFYMYFKQINRIVSLQSCALDENTPMVQTPNNDYECRVDPLFQNVEDKMWDNLKYINNNKLNNRSIELLNYAIEDMTAGTINSWINITSLPDITKPENSTLIHCYAGFGRTGSILAYYIMKHSTLAKVHLLQPYFGIGYDSIQCYDGLNMILMDHVKIDTSGLIAGTDIYNRINGFNPKDMVDEFFNISSVFFGRLFLTRINYIIIYLYFHYIKIEGGNGGGDTIYLYDINKVNDRTDQTNIFDNHIQVSISSQLITTDIATINRLASEFGIFYN